MKVLIESMTKYKFGNSTVRCWRQETTLSLEARQITLHDINVAINGCSSWNDKEIAETLLRLDRMNAVEVLDENGQGIVLYKLNPDGTF